jgi:aminocarboxymuconate-semialdehyde decarboxylase
MRIDVHAHYFSREFMQLFERLGAGADRVEAGNRLLQPDRASDLTERFAAMDRAGIDKEILSISGSAPYFHERGAAIEGTRFANDMYAELVRDEPRRFAAFGSMPLPHVDAALDEIARCLDELGFWGMTINTSILGIPAADPRFDPVYDELNRRGAVLFLHPAGLACGSQPLIDSGLTWPLGAPFEDTMCVLEFMQAGFSLRWPNIKLIVPHLGGTLPFLMQRLDHMAHRFMPGKGTPSEIVRTFWYDTVNGYGPSLHAAIATYGLDRIVFGTDWPYWKGDAHQLAADYLAASGLDAAAVEAISWGNLKPLFGTRLYASAG